MKWLGKKRIYHDKTDIGAIEVYTKDRLVIGFAIGLLGLTIIAILILLEVRL